MNTILYYWYRLTDPAYTLDKLARPMTRAKWVAQMKAHNEYFKGK
jgi:hypothetical protein